jgi:TRAP transporter TAXI family solute receptor
MNLKSLLLTTLLFTSAITTVSAEKIILHTGDVNGNYHTVIGKSLKKELEKHGHTVVLKSSLGSVANVQKVKGKANIIGIVQADVARNFIEHEKGYDNVGITGNLGSECGFLVVRADGVDDIKELKGKKVACGKEGSGTLFTFHNLLSQNEDVKDLNLKYKSGKRYIGKVDNKSYSAYFFMSVPDPKNDKIKEVVSNKNLDFLPMDDLKLGDLGKGDNPIYTILDVPVEKSFTGKNKRTVNTVCTYATLVVDEDATSEKVLNDIYEASKKVRSTQQTVWGFSKGFINKVKDKIEKLKNQ